MKKPITKSSVISAVSKALIRKALTTAARITLMNDITELAQSLKRRAASANEFGESLYVKADEIRMLVEALERKEEQRANWFQMAQKLGEDLDSAEKRIAELESRLESADKLQDSAFRSGLQHGFSLGQTDDQKGYEQSMAAYSLAAGIKVEAE
ncbi:TPA: hypothetical protein ACWZ6B_001009 [Klebsiella pneumoniae]